MKLLVRVFLFPVMSLFYVMTAIRNVLFDLGFFKTRQFSIPIISVGNLSMGGTGKTPHVKKIVELLEERKKRVGIVSRGYGGNYGGYATRVFPDKDNAAALYGDEPVFYGKNLSSPVFVAHDRSSAVELCLKESHPDVIVSDDSFQHRWMGRSRDIVLLDCTDDITWLFPVGRYREPLSSLKRAHLVILTKTNFASAQQKSFWLERLNKKGFSQVKGNLFESSYILDSVDVFRGLGPLKEKETILLASSIARPESFYQLVQERWSVAQHFAFKDHYAWTQKDVDMLEIVAVDKGIKHLLITEKDAVKMENLVFRYLQVHTVKLGLKLSPELKYENLF